MQDWELPAKDDSLIVCKRDHSEDAAGRPERQDVGKITAEIRVLHIIRSAVKIASLLHGMRPSHELPRPVPLQAQDDARFPIVPVPFRQQQGVT